LCERDYPPRDREIDAKEICEFAFILDLPSPLKSSSKMSIERSSIVRVIRASKIIDIYSDDERLVTIVTIRVESPTFASEQAGVILASNETIFAEPREERSLPTAPGLSHSIHGLHDLTDKLVGIRIASFETWRRMTVDRLTNLEFTLKISRDEIPTV